MCKENVQTELKLNQWYLINYTFAIAHKLTPWEKTIGILSRDYTRKDGEDSLEVFSSGLIENGPKYKNNYFRLLFLCV